MKINGKLSLFPGKICCFSTCSLNVVWESRLKNLISFWLTDRMTLNETTSSYNGISFLFHLPTTLNLSFHHNYVVHPFFLNLSNEFSQQCQNPFELISARLLCDKGSGKKKFLYQIASFLLMLTKSCIITINITISITSLTLRLIFRYPDFYYYNQFHGNLLDLIICLFVMMLGVG